VRVGSPKLDNYHRVRGDRGQFTSGASITYEDNVNSIKRRLWLETDRAYRTAAERLIRIKTNTQVQVAEEDNFRRIFPPRPRPWGLGQAPPKLKFDEAASERPHPRTLSGAAFQRSHPSVLTSQRYAVLCPDRHALLRQHRGLAHRARGRGFREAAVTVTLNRFGQGRTMALT